MVVNVFNYLTNRSTKPYCGNMSSYRNIKSSMFHSLQLQLCKQSFYTYSTLEKLPNYPILNVNIKFVCNGYPMKKYIKFNSILPFWAMLKCREMHTSEMGGWTQDDHQKCGGGCTQHI